MNLGDAVYKVIAGRSPRRERDTRSMIERARDEAGGVSQLARGLGVARTTVQRWLGGAGVPGGQRPKPEQERKILGYVRRAELREAREARISTSNRFILKGRQGERQRTINLTPYLVPGTMGRAVEAYLRGASPADLHVIVWAGITDKAYRWMLQPPGGLGQKGRGEVARAVREAQHGSGAAGSAGGDLGSASPTGGGMGLYGGGGGGSTGEGDYDEYGPQDVDVYEGDYDEGDYLDDLIGDLGYEGEVPEVGDTGYEFSVSGAR